MPNLRYADVLRDAARDVEKNNSTYTTLPEPAVTHAAALRRLAALCEEAEALWQLLWTAGDDVKVADLRERRTQLFTALAAGFDPEEGRNDE